MVGKTGGLGIPLSEWASTICNNGRILETHFNLTGDSSPPNFMKGKKTMTNTKTFNLESTIVATVKAEMRDSAKSLAATILGVTELGVDDTKKALKEGYTKTHHEPRDSESRKKFQDARKKWIRRRIDTANRVLESDEMIQEICTQEGDSESRYNALLKYLLKNPVGLKQDAEKKVATDDEVIARFIQAAKACDKRGLLDKALAKLQEIDLEDVELNVAI